MISDVLSDAVAEIREYLDHKSPFPSCYQGPVRERIERLVAEMEAVRIVLDTPPSAAVVEQAEFRSWVGRLAYEQS